MIISSFNMDSIPGKCKALGLVVFSNIIYLFIIYDVSLTAYRIIFSTWLYNYSYFMSNM